MAWEDICSPYGEGGLGIRSLKDTIFGLQGKLAWKIYEGKTIWANLLRQKYSTNYMPGSYKRSQSASKLWKHLYPHFQNVQDIGRWCVGEGKISFWKDNWLGTILDRTSSANITVREGLNELAKWKPALTDEQWREAKSVVLDDHARDELWCTLTPNGKFSVAEYVKSCRHPRPKKDWIDTVWNKFTSFRVNAFSWRVRRGALPMDRNIQTRGIPFVSRCVCCCSPKIETLDHLMLNSDIARFTWDHFAHKIQVCQRAQSIGHMYRIWVNGVNRRSQMGRTTLAILLYGMWEIWKIRCRIKYDEASFDRNQLLRRIYDYVYDINRVHAPKRTATTIEKIHLEGFNIPVQGIVLKKGKWLCWNKPERLEFKLNVDGSCKDRTSAGGGLVRNRQGDFICCFCASYEFDDATLAEIQALHDRMIMCVQRGINGVEIEVDAAKVVSMIKESSNIHWRYAYKIRSVKSLMTPFDSIKFIFREQNMAVDKLARIALRESEKKEFDSLH